MSEFIAESVIIIRADTKLFLAQVKKAAEEAEKIPVVLPVRASMKGFRADLIQKVRNSEKGVFANVLVRPVMTGFRTALREAVKNSAKGVTVPVTVTPARVAKVTTAQAAAAVGTPAAAAAKPAAEVAAKATAAEKAMAEALEAQAFTRKKIVGDLSAQEKSLALLSREEQALKKFTEAENKAIAEGNALLQARAAKGREKAQEAVTKRQDVIARRQAKIDAPRTRVLERAQQVEDEAVALTKRAEAAQTKIIASETEKRAQIEEEFSKREKELSARRLENVSKVEAAADAEVEAEKKRGREVLTNRASADDRIIKEQLRLENQLGRLQRSRTEVPDITDPTTAADLSAINRQAGRDVRQATKEANAARKAGLPLLEAEFREIAKSNSLLREQIALQQRLNKLRASSATSALPQTARTPEAAERKRADALNARIAEGEKLSEDARRAGVVRIQQETGALTENNKVKHKASIEEVKVQENITKTSKARKDARRAINAQSAQLVGLRGAALSAEGAFLAAAAGLILFTKAVDAAADLEQELNVFQATAGATADQMKRVSAAAADLGRDITLPGVSAAGAATALSELSKAGLSVEDSLAAARGTLQLASAAAIDNADAVNFVASAVNAFGLAGNQAVHIADLLAGASKESQQSMEGVGVAFQQAAAAAAQAGITVEDTIALLTGLGRAGLRGSDAGTSLRVAIIRLINPTKKANDALDSLNVRIRDSSGNIRPEVFGDISAALEDLSATARDQTLATIFGQDAFRAASILGKQGAAGLNELRDSTNQVGLAGQLSAARTKGFTGQMEALKNSLSTLGSAVGGFVVPPLTEVVDALTGIASISGQAAEGIKKIVNAIPSEGVGAKDESTFEKIFGFLKGGEGDLGLGVGPLSGLGDIFEQVDALIKLTSRGIPLDPGKSATATIERLDKATLATVNDTDKLLVALSKFNDESVRRGAGGGAQKALSDLRAQLIGTGPAADEAKQKLDALVRLVAALGRAPTEFELETFLEKGSVTAVEQGIGDLRTFAEAPIPMSVVLQGPGTDAPSGGRFPNRFTGFGRGIFADVEGPDPDQIVKGDPGGKIAESLIKGFRDKFSPNEILGIAKNAFERLTTVASTTAPRFAGQGELTGRAFMGGVRKGILDGFTVVLRSINEQAGGLRDEMNRALATGASPEELRAIAQKQLEDANRIVAEADRALADPNLAKKSPERQRIIARRSQALADAAAARSEVDSQTDAIVSAKEQAAADAKEKIDKADQKVLDSLAPRTRALETKALIAEGTTSLKDNIAVAKAQQANNRHQIAVIGATFKDRKKAAELIADLKDENIALDQQINADLQAMFSSEAEAFQVKVNLAEAEGNTAKVLRLFDAEIARLEKVLTTTKKASAKRKQVQTELAKLRTQREDVEDQRIQERIDLGESIFDLTGNKNPLLRALNAAIAETEKDIAAAKRAGRSTTVLQTELNRLLLQRKEVLEDAADKSQQGTTAFDLLSQFTEDFNQISGNLINTQMPFVSPADFTSPIAPFLTRKPTDRNKISFDTGGTPDSTDRAIDRLIDALDRNTRATEGNSTANTGDGFSMQRYVNVTGQRAQAMAKFWEARGAREWQDSSGGRGGV